MEQTFAARDAEVAFQFFFAAVTFETMLLEQGMNLLRKVGPPGLVIGTDSGREEDYGESGDE